MAQDATIISASLNDSELKQSVDSLVQYVKDGTDKMVQTTNKAVEEMKKTLQSLANTKIDMGGTSDGGSSKRAKKMIEEASVAYDKLSEAVSKSTGRMTIMETYDMQLKLLIERLKDVRADIDIFKSAIGSGKTTQIEWGQKGLKEANAEAEKLMRIISDLESKRNALNGIMQPQGHAIQNYVRSLQEVNPELALLNQQYKNGTALLQQKNLALRRSAQEEQQLAKQSADANARVAAYVEQGAERERQRRTEIQQTGQAAREAAKETIRSMYEQLSQETERPITGLKELSEAIMKMRSAYYSMSAEERESQIGRSLEEDIIKANKAITIVQRYNRELLAMQQGEFGKISSASSLDSLRRSLKDLTEQYNRLTVSEIDAGKDTGIRQKFQNITRAAQILQRNLERPVSFDAVMKLDADTLDNISYKMQMLQRYRSGLNVDTQRNEINQVNQAYDSLKKKMDEVMAKSAQMNTMNNALTRSFNYMKNRLAFYFTVGASTAFVKTLIDIRSQYEMNERALGILIDSAEKGTQVFKELSSMALVSPYTLIELSNAAKQLTAYGVAARDVVDTTRRLADISAAVGAPVERIAYALGHVQTYGYLTSLQSRQFANNGIPLVKELAERYSELEGRVVSTADVYDRMKKKQVEYADVIDVVNRMTDEGGRFFDFQAKMADTLKVQLSNLNLAYNNMLNDMGKESQGVIVGAIKGLKQLFLAWKSIDKAIYDVLWTLGSVKLVQAIRIASIGLGEFGKQMTWNILVGKKLSSVIFSLASSFKALALSPATWVAALSFVVVSATRDLMNLNEAQKEFNKSLREAGGNNSKSLTDFLSQYDAGKKAIKKEDAEKVWGEMREQIELTVKKSDEFVGSLLKISDVSERLKKGFELINDINEVNAALKDLDDEAIKIDTDYSKWWNAYILPDGLIDEIEQYTDAQKKLNDLRMSGESLSQMNKAADKLEKQFYSLERSVSATTLSILDLIELKGWSGNVNKINAVFDQVLGKLAEDNAFSPQQAFNLQMAAEKARGQAVEKALKTRIDDERAALQSATDEVTRYEILKRKEALEQELRFFVQNTSEQRVYWRDFTNWIKTQHLAETQAMFRGMNAEQIKSLNFQEGKYFEWIDKLTKQYAKEHNKTYTETFDLLRNYITNANQMSIFIPLVIGTDKKKSLYEELTGADSDIDAAQKKIERLTQRRNELLQKGGRYSNDKKVADDTIRAEEELAQAQKDYNDALEKGGHLKDKNRKDSKKDPLLDALKQEISLVEKLQGDYDKLTKAGATSSDALLAVRSAYGTTIDLLNKDMKKYGLPELNLDIITSQSPKEQLEYFKELKQQLEASGLGTLDRMKAVEGIIEKLDIKVKEYNLDKVTKGLNNELGKLKEEYELAVEFDANPELGNVFADMIGIDKEELEALPRTYDAFVKKMQERINKMFEENEVEGSFDLTKMLNKEQFDSWVKARGNKLEDNFVKALNDIRVETNKIRQNETKKQVEDWNKLLEKYADYEYQISKIHEDAEREREVARKQGAGDDVINAINNRENKDIARVNFEKFQQSQEWIIATGDLAGLTDKALGLLIDRLEEYKKNAKNLDPKQIRQINSALKTLYNNVRSKNPFKALSITIKENRLRREELEKQLEKDQEAFQKSNEQIEKNGHLSEKDSEARLELLDRIKKTKEELKNLKDLTPEDLTQAIQTITQTASMATGAVTDMMKAFGADEEAVTIVNGVMSSLEKAASFAAVGNSIGGVWGAAIGGVIGLFSGLVSSLGDILSGNAAITRQIEKSQRKVAELENTYKNLERAVEDAYGAAKIYTQEVAIQNKKLQLQQLERQLALEDSRKSKYRDEDAIISIKGQIIDLRNEIEDMQRDIVNTFLGISDAGSAVENMVEVIINALREGENAMTGFNDSINDMIANMIKQVISAKIVGPLFNKAWEEIDEMIKERVENAKMSDIFPEWYGALDTNVVETIEKLQEILAAYPTYDVWYKAHGNGYGNPDSKEVQEELYNNWRKNIEDSIKNYQSLLEDYSLPTFDDIKLYGSKLREIGPQIQPYINDIDALLTELGLKKSAEQTLSNLQQGIQGVTEDTAGAIESYLNGVSQQVYLHSDLLTEIRDAVVGMNFDTQLGTIGEILLQLQNSFQTQQAIRGILEGWSNANGMAVKVEMV